MPEEPDLSPEDEAALDAIWGNGDVALSTLFDESKIERDEDGKFASTGEPSKSVLKHADSPHKQDMAAIPVGEARHVRGWYVRRTGEDTYRLDTDRGHVEGPASDVLERIEREWNDQKPDRKRAEAAIERLKDWSEPNWFSEPERMAEEAKAFESLPKGTRVVSLDDSTHGRLGTIVKIDGKSKVKLDGDPHPASGNVEPLDPELSWRKPVARKVVEKPIQRLLFSTKRAGEGRWITIGAKEKDGKRKGGSPVFVVNGRITKGAPSLSGKTIKQVEHPEGETKHTLEAGPETTHRADLKASREYEVAKIKKEARQAGIKPEHLDQLAAEMKAHDHAFIEERRNALRAAHDTAKSVGTNLQTLKARAQSGQIDHSQIKGFDQAAESAAAAYPEFFAGHDPAERLWDLMVGEQPQPMSDAEAYQQALEHLKENPVHETEPEGEPWYQDDEEPVPFSLLSQLVDDGVPFSLFEGKWITIGGRKEGDEEHVGGFRVQIDRNGEILRGGPKELHGKNVRDVKKIFDEQRGGKTSDKPASEEPVSGKKEEEETHAKKLAANLQKILSEDRPGRKDMALSSIHLFKKNASVEELKELADHLGVGSQGTRNQIGERLVAFVIGGREHAQKTGEEQQRRDERWKAEEKAAKDEEVLKGERREAAEKKNDSILNKGAPKPSDIHDHKPKPEDMRPEDAKKELEDLESKYRGPFGPATPLPSIGTPDWVADENRMKALRDHLRQAKAPTSTDTDEETEAEYAEKPGVKLLRAPAGGQISNVNGKFYKGGHIMPVHGLSPKVEKKPKGDGTGTASVANPNEGKEKPAERRERRTTEMSPEEIEEEKVRREQDRKWKEASAGPLGKMKWLGDRPNGKAMSGGVIGLKEWKKFADEIGPEKTKELADKLEKLIEDKSRQKQTERVAKLNARTPEERERDKQFYGSHYGTEDRDVDKEVKEDMDQIRQWAEDDTNMFGRGKHFKNNPHTYLARKYLEQVAQGSIEDIVKANELLQEAQGKGSAKLSTLDAASVTFYARLKQALPKWLGGS